MTVIVRAACRPPSPVAHPSGTAPSPCFLRLVGWARRQNGTERAGSGLGVRSQVRSQSGFPSGSPHERQVATQDHVQEVRQVDQGEASRQAELTPRASTTACTTPRTSDPCCSTRTTSSPGTLGLQASRGPGHGRLRPTSQRSRDRVRRHCSRSRHRPERDGVHDMRRAHQPGRGCRGVADPPGADPAVRPRPRPSAPQPRDHRSRTSAAGAVPRRERHHRQLHAPGHGGTVDVPGHRGRRRVPPRQPHRRRLLRRGHGLRVGQADDLRRADLHCRRQGRLLRGRPQPVVPLELGDLGEQRGPDALSAR